MRIIRFIREADRCVRAIPAVWEIARSYCDIKATPALYDS